MNTINEDGSRLGDSSSITAQASTGRVLLAYLFQVHWLLNPSWPSASSMLLFRWFVFFPGRFFPDF